MLPEFATVASITVICYLIGLVCHNIPRLDNKWIPCIVGLSGLILGVVGWLTIPDYPANNVLDAIAVGIVSGLASTGANQVVKQLASEEEKPVIKIPAYDEWDANGNPVSKEGDRK